MESAVRESCSSLRKEDRIDNEEKEIYQIQTAKRGIGAVGTRRSAGLVTSQLIDVPNIRTKDGREEGVFNEAGRKDYVDGVAERRPSESSRKERPRKA